MSSARSRSSPSVSATSSSRSSRTSSATRSSTRSPARSCCAPGRTARGRRSRSPTPGPGISPAVQTRMFDRFYSVEVNGRDGFGLGPRDRARVGRGDRRHAHDRVRGRARHDRARRPSGSEARMTGHRHPARRRRARHPRAGQLRARAARLRGHVRRGRRRGARARALGRVRPAALRRDDAGHARHRRLPDPARRGRPADHPAHRQGRRGRPRARARARRGRLHHQAVLLRRSSSAASARCCAGASSTARAPRR